MILSILIPKKRSKHIRYDDRKVNGQEKAEKEIKRVLNCNALIKKVCWFSIPIVVAAIVWFGWDLYGSLIHPIGSRGNHLDVLWRAVTELINGNGALWNKYIYILNKNHYLVPFIAFICSAIAMACLVSLSIKRLFYTEAMTAELLVSGVNPNNDVKESINYLKKEFAGEKDTVQVAPKVSIPTSMLSTHMVAFGTTGVGKTQILWNIITAILTDKKEFKLCLFDFKADFIQEYMHRSDFGLIAVYDERSFWWDFMEDIHANLDIDALALQLIPEGNDKDPFWRNTARNLVIDAIAYMKKADLRGWETLYRLLSKRELILAAIEKSDGSSAQSIEKENNTSNSIMVTLNEAIRPIATLARAWGSDGNGRQPISIAKWVAGDSSVPKHLIFGWDENYAQSLAPIFTAFMDGVLARKIKIDSDKSVKIFMAWDEFASIPAKVSKLAVALRTGRALGVSFFLGCLNVNDIYDRYGQGEGKTILGLLCTQFGLLVGGGDGAESAKYISDSWGDQIVKVASWKPVSIQVMNEEGKQKTKQEWEVTWTTTERKAVPPSIFTNSLDSTRQA
ncbi:MAG: type IV secretion system DNA-binding domain-containing protein, partial [Mariprofundus sp.]